MRAPVLVCVALALAAGCAPKTVVRPSGPRSPLTGGAALFDGATASCRGVRTITAELQISGRVGRQKVRGRALVGVSEPASLRLEGIAPFGQPAFILVARDGRGTLLLPRDNRVLRNAAPEQILEALTGVSLGPGALRALLAGCFAPSPPPAGGEKIGDRWAHLTFNSEGHEAYLRRDGTDWHLVAAAVGRVRVEYDDFSGSHPRRVRIRTRASPDAYDELNVVLSQVDMNVALDRAAFDVRVPADAGPLTLDELRAAGPLGQK